MSILPGDETCDKTQAAREAGYERMAEQLHEMSIDDHNADTIHAWRSSPRYASANAHLTLSPLECTTQSNKKLSFIAWAKQFGVEIKPYRNVMFKVRYGMSYRYLVGNDVQVFGITDTFHGAMQVACTAIFGKL